MTNSIYVELFNSNGVLLGNTYNSSKDLDKYGLKFLIELAFNKVKLTGLNTSNIDKVVVTRTDEEGQEKARATYNADQL